MPCGCENLCELKSGATLSVLPVVKRWNCCAPPHPAELSVWISSCNFGKNCPARMRQTGKVVGRLPHRIWKTAVEQILICSTAGYGIAEKGGHETCPLLFVTSPDPHRIHDHPRPDRDQQDVSRHSHIAMPGWRLAELHDERRRHIVKDHVPRQRPADSPLPGLAGRNCSR